MTTYTTTMNDDPFADSGEKRPAVSFKDQPVGTTYTLIVEELPTMAQTKVFGTEEPAFWPAKPGQEANPKMAAVIGVNQDGEARSLWAPKPGSLFTAIAEAQRAAGSKIEVGGTLLVRLDARTPSSKGNPQNIFKVKYAPPAAAPAADPFDSENPPF